MSKSKRLNFDDAGAVVIPLSKAKLVLAIIGCAGFVVLSLVAWFIGDAFGLPLILQLHRKTWAVLGFVFFGGGAILLASMMFKDRPGLMMNPAGIVLRTDASGEQQIPWSDVTGIRVTNFLGQRFLTIDVIDVGEPAGRGGSFRKMLMSANQGLTGSPFNISANALACSFDELWEIMSEAFDRYARCETTRTSQ